MPIDELDTPSVVVERAKREHTKNKNKLASNDEVRAARLFKQNKLEKIEEDEEDWRDYIDR